MLCVNAQDVAQFAFALPTKDEAEFNLLVVRTSGYNRVLIRCVECVEVLGAAV